MSKKRKTNNKKASNSSAAHKAPPKKKAFKWKKWLKTAAIFTVFAALIIGSLMVYRSITQVEYDLSVVGNGTPTVVQIHDPNCQLCRRLKSNLDAVKGEFGDSIQFRTTNIATKKGRYFASKYGVPHVTLLFFDKSGDRINTLQGVTPKDEIRDALTALAKRR